MVQEVEIKDIRDKLDWAYIINSIVGFGLIFSALSADFLSTLLGTKLSIHIQPGFGGRQYLLWIIGLAFLLHAKSQEK